jgi:hypothetical protein
VQRAGATAETIFLVLVLVFVAILVLVANVAFLGAAGLLYLFQGEAIPSPVGGWLSFPTVVNARGVQQATRVEPLALGAVFPRSVVVAVKVLWVALLIVGVGDELGVTAVGAALAIA